MSSIKLKEAVKGKKHHNSLKEKFQCEMIKEKVQSLIDPLRVGDVRQHFTYPKGCLTDSEWQELVTLEYVITWGYTDNEVEDSKRYRELSDKKWDSLNIT